MKYFIIFLVLLLCLFWDTIKIQFMSFIIVQRGTVTTNCFWWNISDLFLEDANGINMYNKLKHKGPFVKLNFFGTPIYLVTEQNEIKDILDNSPMLFGVGKFKYNFFSTFMKDNLGVSQGCPWLQRRKMNEYVLNTNEKHKFFLRYEDYIDNLLKANPSNFNEFLSIGKQLAGQIVFGQKNVPSYVFDMFKEANSTFNLLFPPKQLPSSKLFENYALKQLNNPVYGSLTYLGKKYGASNYEIIHQIPHWIFPLVGICMNIIPRVLILILNSNTKIKYEKDIRNCILETLRLNNGIVTFFRTLLEDYTFENGQSFKKGEQFVIFTNPVMRSEYFYKPNAFVPERWNDKSLTDKYYNLTFGQGPQKCPGKQLALDIMTYFISVILTKNITDYYPKINTNNVPQMINVCTTKFTYG